MSSVHFPIHLLTRSPSRRILRFSDDHIETLLIFPFSIIYFYLFDFFSAMYAELRIFWITLSTFRTTSFIGKRCTAFFAKPIMELVFRPAFRAGFMHENTNENQKRMNNQQNS